VDLGEFLLSRMAGRRGFWSDEGVQGGVECGV
jgi:hypothetical protein